jgi:NSS family neurotransmitter:Na+ symporter
MMAYGRYLPGGMSIGYAAVLVITVDLLFSILSGLSINALMLANGYQPGQDSQFEFHLMPVIFASYSNGSVFGALFFLLLTLAAMTSSIALLEAPVTYLQRKLGMSRLKAAVWLGVILAHSAWNGDGFTLALFFGDEAVRLVNNAGFHDVLVFISSHLLQPFVALFICLLVAWTIPREISYRELALSRRYRFELWNYLVRYIIPVLMLVIILDGFGII